MSDISVYSDRILNTSEEYLDAAMSTGVSGVTSSVAVGSTLKQVIIQNILASLKGALDRNYHKLTTIMKIQEIKK